MKLIKLLGFAVAALSLVGCGSSSSKKDSSTGNQVKTAEDFSEVKAPEYFAVLTTPNGEVAAKAVDGISEVASDEAAVAEEMGSLSGTEILTVEEDDTEAENSSDSYFYSWGNSGRSCYKQKPYSRTNINIDINVEINNYYGYYNNCHPQYYYKNYDVSYRWVSRRYCKKTRRMVNYYRRYSVSHWQSSRSGYSCYKSYSRTQYCFRNNYRYGW